MPDTLSNILGADRGAEDAAPAEILVEDQVTDTAFVGKWGMGTSIFGDPLMNPQQSNSVIELFVEGVERIEQEVGRNVVIEEIIGNGGRERIHYVEIRDQDRQFLQDVVDYHVQEHGEFVGDRYIARAGYQTWNKELPFERTIEDCEADDLPIPPDSLQDKVWLKVQSPNKAPESGYLRGLIEKLSEYETFTNYARDQDLLELENM